MSILTGAQPHLLPPNRDGRSFISTLYISSSRSWMRPSTSGVTLRQRAPPASKGFCPSAPPVPHTSRHASAHGWDLPNYLPVSQWCRRVSPASKPCACHACADKCMRRMSASPPPPAQVSILVGRPRPRQLGLPSVKLRTNYPSASGQC